MAGIGGFIGNETLNFRESFVDVFISETCVQFVNCKEILNFVIRFGLPFLGNCRTRGGGKKQDYHKILVYS